MSSDVQRIRAGLSRLVPKGASAAQIADNAVSIWRDLDAALSPIIGQRGVAALFKRTLALTRPTYPWLSSVLGGAEQPGDFTALGATLSLQTGPGVVAANEALLRNFADLLINLIGGALTERLLRSVWNSSSSGDAVQETSP
jgi:hypothetical protein